MKFLFSLKKDRGFTILYAVLLTSMMLAVTLKLYNVVVKQQLLSSATRASEVAFVAASSGLECALYHDLHAPSNTYSFHRPNTPAAPPNSPIYCNTAVLTLSGSGSDSSNAVWQEICGPTGFPASQCAATKFTVVFEATCAVVSVTKIDTDGNDSQLTKIESRGYNTIVCPGTGRGILERAIRSQYGID